MKRRKFLQLSLITPVVGAVSCKDIKKPAVSKRKPTPRRHDLDSTVDRIDRGLADAGYENVVVRMKVTAYCACIKCCGRQADGVTASGYDIGLRDRFVAADKRYPFGTVMLVPGYGWKDTYSCRMYSRSNIRQLQPVLVLDRGGAIKGNHIDVYFDTHQEAIDWGVQYLDVTILRYRETKK